MIKASIIICTLNRAALLLKCMKSAAAQTLSSGEYEIIVVDNGSTDDTAAVCHKFAREFRNFTYIYESVKGLSRARNAGTQRASADIVAFLDDDSEALPQWLKALMEPFGKTDFSPLAVGGPIAPDWLVERPDWFSDEMLALLLGKNHGDSPKVLDYNHYITGGNMAFNRADLFELGLFNENFGLAGKKMMQNEESELQQRLRNAGGRVYYAPMARIKHIITAERVNKSYMLKRYLWRGISTGVMMRNQTRRFARRGFPDDVSVVLWDIKGALTAPCDKRVWHQCRLLERLGFHAGALWRGWAG